MMVSQKKTLTHASDEMETHKNFNNDVNGGGTLGEASSSGSEFFGEGANSRSLSSYQIPKK